MMKDPAAFPLRKSEITADGTDKVTFTAKYGEEDVTANASIADAATCGEVLSGSEFATETAGSYEFVASYDGKESNKVKVDATAVSGLVLSVDKESIVNDGEDTATFTVTFDGNGRDGSGHHRQSDERPGMGGGCPYVCLLCLGVV